MAIIPLKTFAFVPWITLGKTNFCFLDSMCYFLIALYCKKYTKMAIIPLKLCFCALE